MLGAPLTEIPKQLLSRFVHSAAKDILCPQKVYFMLTMNLRPTLTVFFLLCFLLFIAAEEKEQKTITAESGQTVTLTCRAPNNNNIVVKWHRADLESEHVLLYRDEQFEPDNQHPSFKNRVDLQDRQMKDGDVSVILKNVMINDTGTYECRVVQRVKTAMKLISIITLRVVDPPPGPGGTTEDGGKEDGGKEDGGKEDGVSREHYGLIVSLSVAAVVLVLVAVAVFVNRNGLF